MKRFIIFALVFSMLFSCITVQADDTVSVVIDSVLLNCLDSAGNNVSPFIIQGTVYVPLRAVSEAFNLDVLWDDSSKSVYINGVPGDSEKGVGVNIYINGVKFSPKDANGNIVSPLLQNGTTYLPVRAIGEALNKRVFWDDSSKTVYISSPKLKYDFDDNKTYAIVSAASGKAITVYGSSLVTSEFTKSSSQGFKFIKSDTEGYYHINFGNKNFDVNGNSKNPGASIITYNAGSADNQKFAVEEYGGGYIIYAKSSLLPIEDSAGKIKQNSLRTSVVQQWNVVEFTPLPSEDKVVSYAISANGNFLINTADSLTTGSFSAEGEWLVYPNDNGEYTITNASTQKSLDVANNSKTPGDPVITYKTSSDPNQRWLFLPVGDGTYLIQSVHSSLYLTLNESGGVVQSALTYSPNQCWRVTLN